MVCGSTVRNSSGYISASCVVGVPKAKFHGEDFSSKSKFDVSSRACLLATISIYQFVERVASSRGDGF